MPRFDLRQDDGTFDPLASFKVLAVMCGPHDRVLREKMIGSVQKESRVGHPRRRPARGKHFGTKFDVLTEGPLAQGAQVVTSFAVRRGREAEGDGLHRFLLCGANSDEKVSLLRCRMALPQHPRKG
jgi:hypothetical protein